MFGIFAHCMCVVLCLSFLVCWLLVWVTLAVGCGYSLLISPSTCPFCLSWEGFLICQHVANVLCWPRVNVLLGLPISIHHVKKKQYFVLRGFWVYQSKGGPFVWRRCLSLVFYLREVPSLGGCHAFPFLPLWVLITCFETVRLHDCICCFCCFCCLFTTGEPHNTCT